MADLTQIQRLEDVLGRLLVTGIAISATILGTGLVVELAGGDAHPLLRVGLVCLMATPILRVAVSVVEYVRMRDWFFSATTAAVLIVLLTSVTVALLR